MLSNIYTIDEHHFLFLLSVYKNEILNEFNLNVGWPKDTSLKSKDDIMIFDVHNIYNLWDIEQRYPNIKKIFLDIQGENTNIELNSINEWLSNKNNYLISQRYKDIKNDRALTDLKYLSVLYYFSKFKFYEKSQINLLNNKSEYDFITFLGKDSTKKIYRLSLLKEILGNNLINCKYNHNDFNNIEILRKNQYYTDVYDFSWNILQSYQGKINIIFESVSLSKFETVNGKVVTNFLDNFFYFTEKTLRCLITPTPSILIVDKDIISYLRNVGFDFPYDGFDDYKDVKEYIEYIIKVGIDSWIDNNIKYFTHNSNHMWELAYKKEDTIIKLIKNL